MGKGKPEVPTKEELLDMIDTRMVEKVGTVAEAIFENEFEKRVKGLREQLQGQSTLIKALIIGIIVATAIMLTTLWWDSHVFKKEYQKLYLEAQSSFTQQISELRKENQELQLDLREKVNEATQKAGRIEEKLDHLNDLFLEQATRE